MRKEQNLPVLPVSIKNVIQRQNITLSQLQEIRLREGRSLFLTYNGEQKKLPHIVSKEELRETLDYISNYSLYAFEQELRQGFLTIRGGHRVGLAGQVIIEERKVKNLNYISSLNIRIAHEVKGCADKVFPWILQEGRLCHTLIISPPGCGKTTLLRDLIRQVSDGNHYLSGQNISVVDERSEIGGCYQGIPENDLGERTDILDGCPKAEGMFMLIRSMAPQVLAVDEIGSEEEIRALYYAMNSGVTILATVHGISIEEIRKKPLFERMIKEGWFQRYIILSSQEEMGKMNGVYDERGEKICG